MVGAVFLYPKAGLLTFLFVPSIIKITKYSILKGEI